MELQLLLHIERGGLQRVDALVRPAVGLFFNGAHGRRARIAAAAALQAVIEQHAHDLRRQAEIIDEREQDLQLLRGERAAETALRLADEIAEAAVARLLLALQVLLGVLRALRSGVRLALLLPQAKLAQRVRRADHARDGEVQGGQRRFARQFRLAV